MSPPLGTRDPRVRLAGLILVLLVLPAAYVAAINAAVAHESLTFEAGWSDSSFSGWTVNASADTTALLSVSNGSLSVISGGTVTPQQFVAADSPNLSAANVTKYPFLIVSVKAPAYYVAARIGIWTGKGALMLVLVKTYADTARHTEVIDLRFFGLSWETPIRTLELGWTSVERPALGWTEVQFQGLELARRVGGPA